MIPRANITAWRAHAPWATDAQVEQDLVIARALVDIFSEPSLADALAFRGGTALHKLFFRPAARYSEDIDLVQVRAEPIGPVMDALRARLDPWLGAAQQWKQREGRVTFQYRFDSETLPTTRLRLKVEINTREHFAVHGHHPVRFGVESPWFAGEADIKTFMLEELLATKLRALYQRKKGRDLFDLAHALQHRPDLDRQKVVDCFEDYMKSGSGMITRATLEENLAEKEADPIFLRDVETLLAFHAGFGFDADAAFDGNAVFDGPARQTYNGKQAMDRVKNELIALLPRVVPKRRR